MKKRTKFRGPYLVEWLDVTGSAEWHTPDDLPDASGLAHSLGWVICEDAEFLTMAASRMADDSLIGDVLRIPRSLVRRKRKVTL